MSPVLAPLIAAIRDVMAWLASARAPGAVVGGVAAAIRGTPRVTKDVDWLIRIDDSKVAALVAKGKRFGIVARIPKALDFAKTTRVLLLKHEPTSIELDVSLAMLPFENEVIDRALKESVAGVEFPVATAEDIIVMKALALRPRDIADIEGILEAAPQLDLKRVRAIVRQMSDALETEDFSGELERLLSASGREHPRATTGSAAPKRVSKKRVSKKRVSKTRRPSATRPKSH